MVKGDKIWQSSEYFMNVFCNNALPAPSLRRIPICMGKYNDVVSIRSGLYNQNSYTLGVTYNGVDYDSTSTRAIAAPECIDVKGAGIYSNTYKTPLSVAVVLNLNCQ